MLTKTAKKVNPIEAKLASGTSFAILFGIDGDPSRIRVFTASTVAEYRKACLAALKLVLKAEVVESDDAKTIAKIFLAGNGERAASLINRIRRDYAILAIRPVED